MALEEDRSVIDALMARGRRYTLEHGEQDMNPIDRLMAIGRGEMRAEHRRPEMTPHVAEELGAMGTGEAFARMRGTELLPFLGHVIRGGRTRQFNQAFDRLEAGEGDEWEQANDRDTVIEFLREASEMEQRGMTIPAEVTTRLARMAPYAIEFMATSGIGKAGATVGAKLGLKGVAATAHGTIGRTAAKAGTRLLAGAGSAVARSPAFAGMTFATAQEKMLSSRMKGEKVSPVRAYLAAFGDTLIELFAEESSEAMGRVVRKIPGVQALSRKFDDIVRSKIGWDVGRYGKVLKQAGYHGPILEVAEEDLGAILRSVAKLEGDDPKLWNRLKETVPGLFSRERMLQLITFSIPAIPGSTVRAATGIYGERQQELFEREMEEAKRHVEAERQAQHREGAEELKAFAQ
ncbi:MAG: hypothetical protein QGH74_01990, partial [Candidatus Brocadiia bacterium]|nr:hypothetical protein [Candidatus Brocadiia bacterium]